MPDHFCQRSSSRLVTERAAISQPAPIRSEQVCVRLTPQEKAEAEVLAARYGTKLPELLRDCLRTVQLQEAMREIAHV